MVNGFRGWSYNQRLSDQTHYLAKMEHIGGQAASTWQYDRSIWTIEWFWYLCTQHILPYIFYRSQRLELATRALYSLCWEVMKLNYASRVCNPGLTELENPGNSDSFQTRNPDLNGLPNPGFRVWFFYCSLCYLIIICVSLWVNSLNNTTT